MSETLEGWLDEAATPAYWAGLCPELGLSGATVPPLPAPDDVLRGEILGDLLRDGYFQLPPLLPADAVARMADGILRLRRAHLPAVFMYVYDDLYHLGSWMRGLLAMVLGEDFRALPNVWAWCVAPTGMDKGWHPHRDRDYATLDKRGLPRSLSLWIPLTDATPLNGCMYCVPASRDAQYRARSSDTKVLDAQEVRALPAAAGSVLGWNQALLHWGGRGSDKAAGPRVSFSIEYQRGDDAPIAAPLIDPSAPPPFERRLALIARQILAYRHMTTMGDEFEEVARRLGQRFKLG